MATAELRVARSLVRETADRIAAGQQARIEVSMVETVHRERRQGRYRYRDATDGRERDRQASPIAAFDTTARQFRFIDGVDEVHKRVIAREAFNDPATEELDPITRYER